ncbi:MAG: hypothetical protein HOK37_16165 [Gammaproteobacteria bacterium]|jgi:hypothetical protein|nr:hypothetical protein [Gammaproteobacteria bacterium]MBT7579040.1 hypothetical protein [Candidatus Neomarinimicrobiota bacterium]
MSAKQLTLTQSKWSDRISAWETSGLSQSAFCKQHQLVYGTFVYWRSHLKKLNTDHAQSDSVSFLPITLTQEKKKSLLLRINNLHGIELQPGFDAELLRQVVKAIA